MLEDPWFDASAPEHKEMYKLSVSPEDAPDRPDYLELLFEEGICVGLLHPELGRFSAGSATMAAATTSSARFGSCAC